MHIFKFTIPLPTHGYGSVVTTAYQVEEVSGSRSGCVILKTLKIEPTAALFGVEHIRVRLVILSY